MLVGIVQTLSYRNLLRSAETGMLRPEVHNGAKGHLKGRKRLLELGLALSHERSNEAKVLYQTKGTRRQKTKGCEIAQCLRDYTTN